MSIPGSPQVVLREMLRKYVPLVKTYMGDTYGESVKCCLESYSGEDRSPEETYIRNSKMRM
jgi:hypothetical protein